MLDKKGLRPTPDRIRETLFNWLTMQVPGSHVLDCFAGAGGLGMEAASRDAKQVTSTIGFITDELSNDESRFTKINTVANLNIQQL